MSAPAPVATRRARSTHSACARQAQGVQRPTTAGAQTSPMTASGIPNTTDSGLVVTNVQLTTPLSGQASAEGSA